MECACWERVEHRRAIIWSLCSIFLVPDLAYKNHCIWGVLCRGWDGEQRRKIVWRLCCIIHGSWFGMHESLHMASMPRRYRQLPYTKTRSGGIRIRGIVGVLGRRTRTVPATSRMGRQETVTSDRLSYDESGQSAYTTQETGAGSSSCVQQQSIAVVQYSAVLRKVKALSLFVRTGRPLLVNASSN